MLRILFRTVPTRATAFVQSSSAGRQPTLYRPANSLLCLRALACIGSPPRKSFGGTEPPWLRNDGSSDAKGVEALAESSGGSTHVQQSSPALEGSGEGPGPCLKANKTVPVAKGWVAASPSKKLSKKIRRKMALERRAFRQQTQEAKEVKLMQGAEERAFAPRFESSGRPFHSIHQNNQAANTRYGNSFYHGHRRNGAERYKDHALRLLGMLEGCAHAAMQRITLLSYSQERKADHSPYPAAKFKKCSSAEEAAHFIQTHAGAQRAAAAAGASAYSSQSALASERTDQFSPPSASAEPETYWAYISPRRLTGAIYSSFRELQSDLGSAWDGGGSEDEFEFAKTKSRMAAALWLERRQNEYSKMEGYFSPPPAKKRRTPGGSSPGSAAASTPSSAASPQAAPSLQATAAAGRSELGQPASQAGAGRGGSQTAQRPAPSAAPYTPPSAVPYTPPLAAPLVVYTDGACRNNGRPGAVGGWGYFCPSSEIPSTCGPLERSCSAAAAPSNSRAELTAIIKVLERVPASRALEIRSDSEYAIKSACEWLPRWEKNNFATAARTPVKNQDLMRTLARLLRGRSAETRWTHVRGHAGNEGNERADALARAGMNQSAGPAAHAHASSG